MIEWKIRLINREIIFQVRPKASPSDVASAPVFGKLFMAVAIRKWWNDPLMKLSERQLAERRINNTARMLVKVFPLKQEFYGQKNSADCWISIQMAL